MSLVYFVVYSFSYYIIQTDLSNPDKTEAPFRITRLQCIQNNPINALFKKEIQKFPLVIVPVYTDQSKPDINKSNILMVCI